ncbi:MAG TPA: BON domain-containing protein [Pyrinomonadaceae bacterium]
MRRLTVFALALAMLTLASACAAGDNANNSNANATNANRAANANAANANAANANTANANTANSNRDWGVNVTEADYERRKGEFSGWAKEQGDTIGSGLKDGWLHVKTRGALAAINDLEDSNINVDVNDGVITLRGSLPNRGHVDAAVKAANGIDGKKSVKNELKVAAAGAAGNGNNANHNATGGSH